jgi:hypothetical protein
VGNKVAPLMTWSGTTTPPSQNPWFINGMFGGATGVVTIPMVVNVPKLFRWVNTAGTLGMIISISGCTMQHIATDGVYRDVRTVSWITLFIDPIHRPFF